MQPRLAWLEDLQGSINRALGGTIQSMTVFDTADPLKKLARFYMNEELPARCYHPFRIIANAFAEANGCVLALIRRERRDLILEILLRYRLGPGKRVNPFLVDEKAGARGHKR